MATASKKSERRNRETSVYDPETGGYNSVFAANAIDLTKKTDTQERKPIPVIVEKSAPTAHASNFLDSFICIADAFAEAVHSTTDDKDDIVGQGFKYHRRNDQAQTR